MGSKAIGQYKTKKIKKVNGNKNVEIIIMFGTNLIKAINWILISIGSISLMISVISDSQTLAFIGLGLLFWGALLFYIQPEEYTKKVLLDATTLPSLETLSQIIDELGYKGKATYLPSKYFKNPEENKVYLSKKSKQRLPEFEVIVNQEKRLFIKNPNAILFTPPGSELANLFEKRLGMSFNQTNLQHIKRNLPRILTEDLEIAEKLEIEINPAKPSTKKIGIPYGTIHVKITNSIFKDIYNENTKYSKIVTTIGSPICSSIAIVLTKVTEKPLVIDKIKSFQNGKIIEVTYKVEELEYNEQIEAPLVQMLNLLDIPKIFSKLTSLLPLILGSLILIWIGYLTYQDIVVWNKNLDTIFFASRTGEPIGLGIGMKLVYYLVIGLILLFSGLLLYLQKKREET